MKDASEWYSERLQQAARLVRWGHYGMPVLLFPTAGGDAGECEHNGLIEALAGLLHDGRIKVYSCDSVAGRILLERRHGPEHIAWLQNQYDGYVYHEVVAAIRSDCRSPDIEIVTAGASIGAFNAVASLCRHPDAFRLAIGMSGTYDLEPFYGSRVTDDLYFSSPLHFLPNLADDSRQLAQLRRRFALLAYGQGRWEDPREAWRLAEVLGRRGIPNRVDVWGPEWDHDWPTWRAMLPHYLGELTS